MDKLEFENENQGRESFPSRERNYVVDLDSSNQKKGEAAQQALAVEFSKKVIEALDQKTEHHNKILGSDSIHLVQLKKVYRNGAEIFSKIYKESYPEKNCGLWALARVNMYLRMRLGKVIESGGHQRASEDELLDISESWTPLDEDFDLAKADIKKYKLNYNFDNVNELYLDEYERLDINWE